MKKSNFSSSFQHIYTYFRNKELTLQTDECFISPENVEDEAKIIKLESYQTTTGRVILFWFLAVLTGGAFLLLCKWMNSWIIAVKYIKTTPEKATAHLIFGLGKSHS